MSAWDKKAGTVPIEAMQLCAPFSPASKDVNRTLETSFSTPQHAGTGWVVLEQITPETKRVGESGCAPEGCAWTLAPPSRQ